MLLPTLRVSAPPHIDASLHLLQLPACVFFLEIFLVRRRTLRLKVAQDVCTFSYALNRFRPHWLIRASDAPPRGQPTFGTFCPTLPGGSSTVCSRVAFPTEIPTMIIFGNLNMRRMSLLLVLGICFGSRFGVPATAIIPVHHRLTQKTYLAMSRGNLSSEPIFRYKYDNGPSKLTRPLIEPQSTSTMY